MSQSDGFQFDLFERNEKLKEKLVELMMRIICLFNLLSRGYKVPVARKTGTTIVGIVFQDGVVLGADTRYDCVFMTGWFK